MVYTHSKLDECLVCRSTNALDDKHDIVLSSASVESPPNTPTAEDYQAQDVYNLPAELHRRRDPDDIKETKKEVVQGGCAVHVG